MNIPHKHIEETLDQLTHSSLSFALYRLPWTDECCFVMQTSGEAEQLKEISALNGKCGFVIAPFYLSEAHPLVLIRPDVTACGWEEWQEALAAIDQLEAIHTLWQAPDSHASEPASKQAYLDAFEQFMIPLREKQLQKLVLSRATSQPLATDFSPTGAFIRACNRYPRMMIYLCHTPASGTWIGSTPEILLSGHDKEWHTVALAGTMPMQNEVMPTDWSLKNQEEQECVARYLRQTLKKSSNKITEKGPYTARAGQLVHLKTDFYFLLKHTDKLGDLLQELHPTPAVCGLPKEDAFRFIATHEGYDRRYYSGFIGWLDPQGSTELYVNLRCMEIQADTATLYAGGGILASSEAEAEWEETGEKIKTIRNVIDTLK